MPGIRERRLRKSPARLRRVSRSSPYTFSAIWARTPESRWSSRCEMGCPTLVAAGRVASRVRMSWTTASRLRSDTLRSMSISEECTPSACSSSSARPVLRPTWMTSGTCSASCSASVPMRLDSASDVPGLSNTLTVNVPSLKGGKNERGKNGTLAATASTTINAPTSRPREWFNDQFSKRASQRLSQAARGLSPACNCFMRGSR